MHAIRPGEECAVIDEHGQCHTQATMFYFGEGKNAERHVCPPHHRALVDKEVEARRAKRQ